MEETNGCNSAHHLNAPEDEVTMEEIMVMDKEISKVEARGEAVSPSILLLPSSALVSASAGLRWSLISILPHPHLTQPRESMKMTKQSQTK